MYLNFVGGNLSPTFKGAIALQLMDGTASLLKMFCVECVKVEMGDLKMVGGGQRSKVGGSGKRRHFSRALTNCGVDSSEIAESNGSTRI